MDLLAREPQFATYGVMFDFPAAGQTPHGAHIDGQKGANLFRCHKRAVQCPVDACHLRHGGVYGRFLKTKAGIEFFRNFVRRPIFCIDRFALSAGHP